MKKNELALGIDDFITGSGGGKNKQRAPVEAPNTLQSRATIKVVEVLSEGEIVGLVGGLKGVYLDETPIQNASGSFNFPSVLMEERHGTPDQTHIPGFPGAESALVVNVEVNNDPVIRSVSSASVDAVRIIVRLPQGLSSMDTKSGDLNGYRVGVAVDTRPAGGTWTTAYQRDITGKAVTPYEEAYRIEKPAGISGIWEVRVRRTTVAASTATISDRLDWFTMTEIQDIKVAYESAAVVGLAFDADSTGGAVPRRSYLIDGLIIKVPTNYTPTVYNTDGSVASYASYSGVWNGTFKQAWCDDPAWVLYDLLTNERYGMGEHIDVSNIDIYSFYEASKYNVELVDDGTDTGTMEPRFRCNMPVQSRDDAYKILQSVAATFRAAIFSGPGYLKIIQDRPSAPTATLTNANVIDGQFMYTGTELASRITAVDVTFNDSLNRYLPATITEEADAGSISAYGFNKAEFTAIGVVHEGQARRLGKWVLDNALNSTEVVSFKVSWSNAFVEVGDVVNIADNWYADEQYSGLIKAGGSGVNQIKLDRNVTVTSGQTIKFMTFTGVEHTRTITNTGTTDTLTLAAVSGSVNPSLYAGSPYTILGVVNPRQFKIASVKESAPGVYDLSASYHDPYKYARVEEGVYILPPPFTTIGSSFIEAPENVVVSTETYLDSNQSIQYRIRFNWDDVDNRLLKGYKIRYRRNNAQYVWTDMIHQSEYVLQNVTSGTYEYTVYAYNTANVQSPGTDGYYSFVVGDETPSAISAPTGLLLASGGTAFTGPKFDIAWTAPPQITQATLKDYRVEIYNGSTLVKTIFQTGTALTITNTDVISWAGSAIRSIKVEVRARDTLNRYGIAAQTIFTNAAPAALTNAVLSTEWQYYILKHDAVAGADVSGVRIHHSKTAGFTPTLGNLAKTDQGTEHFIEAQVDTTYYVKAAAYDTWGVDELNYTAEMTIVLQSESALAQEIIDRIEADADAAEALADGLADEAAARAAAIAAETAARTTAINNEAAARIAADVAEATARVDGINAEAAARAAALLDYDIDVQASFDEERILRQSGDDSLAASIATLTAGSGEQFDSKVIWYFDTALESWVGNGTPTISGGYLRPANHLSDPYVASPTGLAINTASYRYVKARIKRTGTPTWVGEVRWRNPADGASSWTGPFTIVEPTFDSNGIATIDFKAVTWSGTIDQIRLDLSSVQSASDYFEIDWVAVGRPSPGASVAALEEEKQARISADAAEASSRTTLASQMRGTYTGTDVAALSSGLLYNERIARTTADSALASDITSLQTTVNNPTTGVAAIGTAVTALTTRVTNAEGVNTSQGSAITSLQNTVNNATTGVAATASALAALTTRVTSAEGVNTTQSSSITALQNTVNDPVKGNNALSSAVTGLDSRLDVAEGSIDSLSSSVTSLTSSINGKTTTFAQPAQPPTTGRVVGDLWIDTDDGNKLYTWTGSAWAERALTAGAKIWAQAAQPSTTGNTVNDLWIDTDDGNKLYRWNGTSWSLADDGRISTNAAAITSLTTRVTAAEGINTSQSAAITSLENTVNNPTTGVGATATAVTNLTTRVTAAEGVNTSQGSAITSLQNTVNNATTGVAATAAGLSALTTRVTTAEGNITSQGSAITSLTNSINNPTTGLSANASAVSALTTRVTTAESTIAGQGATLTSLSNSVTSLTASLPGGGNLLKNATYIAGLAGWDLSGTAVGRTYSINNAGAAWQIPNTNNIGSFVGGVTTAGQYADIRNSLDPVAVVAGKTYIASSWAGAHRSNVQMYIQWYDSANSAISTVVSATVTGYTPSFAGTNRIFAKGVAPVNAVKAIIIMRHMMTGESDAYSWFTQPMLEECSNAAQSGPSAWNAGGGDSAKAIQALEVRVTNAEGVNTSQASSITSLNSTVNNPTTGVAATASAVSSLTTSVNSVTGKVNAAFNLALDVNGYVSGFRSENTGTAASFTVLADNFRIVTPGESPKIPFAVSGGNVRINTDMYMGNGRIVSQSGGYMKVQGTGFGISGELLEWFGPVMPIGSCSRGNGKYWFAANGDAYFGGSLTAGILKTSVTNPSSTGTEIIDGPLNTNGNPINVIFSFSHQYNTSGYGTLNWSSGALPTATLQCYRKVNGGGEVLINTMNLTGYKEIENNHPGDAPSGMRQGVGGSFTYLDQGAGAGTRTYRLVLTSYVGAGFSTSGPGPWFAPNISRAITIITTEQ